MLVSEQRCFAVLQALSLILGLKPLLGITQQHDLLASKFELRRTQSIRIQNL
jgi:hypothetical protein